MSALPKLEKGEVLVDGSEFWWRQCPVGPAFYDEVKGQPSSLMFRWTASDLGKLSGARESGSTPVTAADAYKHATEVEKRDSKGTWGIRASTAKSIGSQFIDDSANLPAPPISPPGHTYLDLRHVPLGDKRPEKDERERLRGRLLLAARRHFPPA